MKYTAKEIKNWDSNTEINGDWVPARPVTIYSLRERIKLAYLVFIGEYDALDWEEDSEKREDKK